MQTIHTNKTINITELKKNPIQVSKEVTCVLSRGKPVFYCVPAEKYNEIVEKLFDPIFDIFHIGSNARNIRTLQTNVKNAARRSDCLFRIENIVTETLVSDEPESYGEEYQESLLNWGESPDEYEARFKSLWSEKLHKIEELQSEIDSLKEKLAKVESVDYVVVPKEPTKQQIEAGVYAVDLVSNDNIQVVNVYKAMIEA